MTVKELIKQLETFDEDLIVIMKNESENSEHQVIKTAWEFDGYCKILVS